MVAAVIPFAVTDLINVRYLSGFSGSNGALLVLADDPGPVLATDGRIQTGYQFIES